MEENLLIAWKELNFGLLGVITFLPRLVNYGSIFTTDGMQLAMVSLFLQINLISSGTTNKIENIIFTAERMIVEKKQVLDPERIMKIYVIAYKQGRGSLDPKFHFSG